MLKIRKNGAISLTNGHDGSISSCFIDKEGLMMVSGGYDRVIGLWDLIHRKPKLILRVYTFNIFLLLLSLNKILKTFLIQNIIYQEAFRYLSYLFFLDKLMSVTIIVYKRWINAETFL